MAVIRKRSQQELVIDQFSRQAPWYSKLPATQDDSIRRLLAVTQPTANDVVLDVACGSGQVAVAFAAVAKYVTGIDITPAMIDGARVLQRNSNLENVSWLTGDVGRMPFQDGTFSIVTCRYALHHMLDPAHVAKEMARVCAPGGRVAFVDVVITADKAAAYDGFERLRDPSHVRALTIEELQDLAKNAGLKQLSCEFYRFDVELEALLRASFPSPGDEARIRDLAIRSMRSNKLGIEIRGRGEEILLSYPIALIVSKREMEPL